MGELKYFLGVQIKQTKEGIFIHQRWICEPTVNGSILVADLVWFAKRIHSYTLVKRSSKEDQDWIKKSSDSRELFFIKSKGFTQVVWLLKFKPEISI
ncbi:hypothetical protein GUJ93_ZPchr0002g23266 [Zizania palustris]|uniref:Uncharacterized protein n=1 Tax=Zizania palustris TaxID=103762 RepID=A0A8J5S5J6_ZIZPA|nr:hypothetical protein GUJ93_ZPchr0002g23266 [Zizania palustris]